MAVDAPDVDSAAVQLAVPLSIAVRIEPELIRAIRLAILPYLDVSAESALWFADNLVAARDPDAIVLRPELLPVLRARLAFHGAHSATKTPSDRSGTSPPGCTRPNLARAGAGGEGRLVGRDGG